MITNTDIERFVTNVSIALVAAGGFLFFYGVAATTPSLSASLLGAPKEITAALGIFVPQSVFFAACLLIVGGACLDVWRRLRML